MKRTHILETKDLVGKEVELFGWVHGRRDHGKIIFIDLRDRSGVAQVVFGPWMDSAHSINSGQAGSPQAKESYHLAADLRSEWVILIKGLIKEFTDNVPLAVVINRLTGGGAELFKRRGYVALRQRPKRGRELRGIVTAQKIKRL